MEIVMSWDAEYGCQVEEMKRRLETVQNKYDPRCNGGYIQIVTSVNGMSTLVFSTEWLSASVAENFVVETLKAA